MNIRPSDPLSKIARVLREHASPTPIKGEDNNNNNINGINHSTSTKKKKKKQKEKKTPRKTPNHSPCHGMTSSEKKGCCKHKHHSVPSVDLDDTSELVSPTVIIDKVDASNNRIRNVLLLSDEKSSTKKVARWSILLSTPNTDLTDVDDDERNSKAKSGNNRNNKQTEANIQNTFQTPSPYLLHEGGQRCHCTTQTPKLRQTLFSPTFSQPNTTERKMIKKFDDEYKHTLLDEIIGTQARQESVRNIMLFTIALFTLYLILGCLYYSVWEEQSKWPLQESLIFLIYTVTTVGYGNHDIPSSPRCRVVTIIFILVGIGLVTVFFSEIFQFLVIKAARAQFIHDEERLTLRGLNAMQFQSDDDDDDDDYYDDDEDEGDVENQARHSHFDSFKRSIHNTGRVSNQFARYLCCSTYYTVKKNLKNTRLGRYFIVLFPFISLLLVGSVVVGCIEGWSMIDSLYWAVVTLTTVGYGDMTPSETASIWFSIFYLPTATIFLSLFLSHIASAYIHLHMSQVLRIEKKLKRKCSKDVVVENNEQDIYSPTTMIELNPSGETENSTPEQNSSDMPSLSFTLEEHKLSMKDLMVTAKKAERITKKAKSKDDPIPQDASSTPSLSLRSRVQERLAFIIAHEVCRDELMVKIKESDVVLSQNWNQIFKKWMIPKKSKESFKTVYCSIVFSVGKNALVEGGQEVLLEMNPEQFQKIFNPFTVAMGSSTCLEAWLASTAGKLEQVN